MPKRKYETHVLPNLDKVREWTEQGAPIHEIADRLHIGASTFKLYLKLANDGDERYSALLDCITSARVVSDDEVEAALFKLACGYKVQLQKTAKLRRVEYDSMGHRVREWEELVPVIEEVNVPANVNAQQFWLANRSRDRWSYKPELAGGQDAGDAGGVIFLPEIATPEPDAAVVYVDDMPPVEGHNA